jgi:hypothetical protein
MRRREFFTLLGGGTVAWPCVATAQQPARMRRISVFMPKGADDPITQIGVAAFMQGLQELGWVIGRNVRIEIRWTPGDDETIRRARRSRIPVRGKHDTTPWSLWWPDHLRQPRTLRSQIEG